MFWEGKNYAWARTNFDSTPQSAILEEQEEQGGDSAVALKFQAAYLDLIFVALIIHIMDS